MNERKCCACNTKKDKKEFIKITKDYKTDEIIINPDKFHFGRSLYICKSKSCIDTAFKKDRIAKNLKIFLTKEEKENINTVLNTMLVVQH